jgi:hypothetical protein
MSRRHDPVTFVSVIMVLLAVAVAAVIGPRGEHPMYRRLQVNGIDMRKALAYRSVSLVATLALLSVAGVRAQTPAGWDALTKMQGDWIADAGAGGKPGAATRGGETWKSDLDGKVIIRRDFSEYPAAAGRPAFRHEGITVFAQSPDGKIIAHAYDNEGHVIDYDVVASSSSVVMTSKQVPGAPQFRLTYSPHDTAVGVSFEIATPDAPGTFKPYVSGTVRRPSGVKTRTR